MLSKLIILFLFSASAMAANVPIGGNTVSGGGFGGTPSVNVPLNSLTKTAGVFEIICGDTVGGITTNNYYPCYKNGVAYAPPNGSTFKAVSMCTNCASTNCGWQVVQDNGAAITYNQVGALTTGVFLGGAATRFPWKTSGTANTEECRTAAFQFSGSAANGQIAMQPGQGFSIGLRILGFEVTP